MPNILDILKSENPAVQLIQSLVTSTLPASTILQQVRDNGLGIRTQTAYQVINYLRDVTIPSRSYISSVNLNAYPTISRLPLSLTKQLRNFAYEVKLTGFSNLSGQLQDKYITISTNQLLTKQQAIDAATGLAATTTQSGSLNGASGQVTGVTQNIAGLVSSPSALASYQLSGQLGPAGIANF